MPGPYDDFAACVADNPDKDDPAAFCAWLEQQTAKRRAFKGEGTHGGVIVALVPGESAARALELPGGEPVEDLHLTLAYLGDAASFTDVQKAQLLSAALRISQFSVAPLKVKLNGTGLFANDGELAVVALADSPELPGLRQRVVDELSFAGLPVKMDHGFTPHITLAYTADEGLPMPTGLELAFDELAVWIGDDHYAFPFVQPVETLPAAPVEGVDETMPALMSADEPKEASMAAKIGNALLALLSPKAAEVDEITDEVVKAALAEVLADVSERGGPELTGPIIWKDDAKQIAYAPVLVPGEPDTDGDVVSAEKVEEVAHNWLEKYRNIDYMHDLKNVDAVPVESYLTTHEMEVKSLEGDDMVLPIGTWVMASKVRDREVWNKVKSGELSGYSIMGVSSAAKAALAATKGAAAFKRTTLADLGSDWEAPYVSLVDHPAVPKAKFFALKARAADPETPVAPNPAPAAEKKGRRFSAATLAELTAAYDALGLLINEAMAERAPREAETKQKEKQTRKGSKETAVKKLATKGRILAAQKAIEEAAETVAEAADETENVAGIADELSDLADAVGELAAAESELIDAANEAGDADATSIAEGVIEIVEAEAEVAEAVASIAEAVVEIAALDDVPEAVTAQVSEIATQVGTIADAEATIASAVSDIAESVTDVDGGAAAEGADGDGDTATMAELRRQVARLSRRVERRSSAANKSESSELRNLRRQVAELQSFKSAIEERSKPASRALKVGASESAARESDSGIFRDGLGRARKRRASNALSS